MNWRTDEPPIAWKLIVTIETASGHRYVEIGEYGGNGYWKIGGGLSYFEKVVAWDFLPKPYR